MRIVAFPSDGSRYGVAIEEKQQRELQLECVRKDEYSRSVQVQALPSEPKVLVKIIIRSLVIRG